MKLKDKQGEPCAGYPLAVVAARYPLASKRALHDMGPKLHCVRHVLLQIYQQGVDGGA